MKNIKISTIGMVCFIDDNKEFVEMLSMSYQGPHAVVAYTDPHEALARLKSDNTKLREREKLINSIFTEENIAHRFRMAIDWLFDEKRHDVIEVVFCDSKMPTMSGFDLLRQIRPSRMRRVLLTGESDAATPIMAFNDGVIDTYLAKSNLAEMMPAIQMLSERGPRVAIDYLWRDLDETINQALYEVSVQERIEKIMAAQLVEEHILIPDPAGLLCRTKDGRCIWLQLETHNSLTGVVEILREEGWEQSRLEPIIAEEMTACVEARQYAMQNGAHEGFQVAELHPICAEPWLAVAAFDLPSNSKN